MEIDIDEMYWSRQLYILDEGCMQQLKHSKVLIIGLRGLGIEAAKNLLLSGINSISLFDDGFITSDDLSTNFFLTNHDIGKPISTCCADKLSKLSPYATVNVIHDDLAPQMLLQFQVVIMTNQPLQFQMMINQLCHTNNIHFISASTRGVFANIFTDFGPSFTITDPDGRPFSTGLITSISQGNPTIVHSNFSEGRIPFANGDYIKFSDIGGMTQLNNTVHPIKISGYSSFEINLDTSQFDRYKSGGYISLVKPTSTLTFMSLQDSLTIPTFNSESQILHHIAFRALDIFQSKNAGNLPKFQDEKEAQEVINIANDIKTQYGVEKIDEKMMKMLAFGSRGQVPAIVSNKFCENKKFLPTDFSTPYFIGCSIIGGIVAQETIKSVTHKFSPIHQYFYFDAMETLSSFEYIPTNSSQIAVFGPEIMRQIQESKLMLVGCGSIGCELLKNWELMGVEEIHVVDKSVVKKSNLSRQFLFGMQDIGKPKTQVVAEKIKQRNPNIKITCGDSAENQRNFNFAAIFSAVDNVQTRLFLDEKCVLNKKNLIDCGADGLKGSVQVVVPNITESYGTSRDSPNPIISHYHGFPMFPGHNIEWAKSILLNYQSLVAKAKGYIKDPSTVSSNSEDVFIFLNEIPRNFQECVVWARFKFEEHFNNKFNLLYELQDAKVGWRTPPVPIHFDINNPLHLNFVIAAANLQAQVFEINTETNILEIIKNIEIPPYFPEKKKEEAEAKPIEPPPTELYIDVKINSFDFDVDNDTQSDFLYCAANLRGINYSIELSDRLTVKKIAGDLIPGIITTASIVAGFACLELIKLIQHKTIQDYRNRFFNLALPLFTHSKPSPPPINKVRQGWKWTLWDAFVIPAPMTIQELNTHFKEKYQYRVQLISWKSHMLYTNLFPHSRSRARLNKQIQDIAQEVTKEEILDDYIVLNVVGNLLEQDEDTEETEIPQVKFLLESVLK